MTFNGQIIDDGKVHNNLQKQVCKNTEDIAYLVSRFETQEDTNNKVTIISSTSTDTQYPSAKASYTYCQSIKSQVEAQIPHFVSQLTNDLGYITQHQSLAAYRTAAQQDIIDAQFQVIIPDLTTIRAGAEAGATAVQPSALNNYYTKAQIDDMFGTYIADMEALAYGVE